MKKIEWDSLNITLLRKHYPTKHNDKVAKLLATTVSAVRNAAIRYKVKKALWYWSKKDGKFLLKNYKKLSIAELMEKFPDRKKWGIIQKYRTLAGLRQNNQHKK